ncbi:MAG: hypothetical protein JWN95_2586 [Frankiales bacterium]|nr:hypothetical protein [Frankiales bacterium]
MTVVRPLSFSLLGVHVTITGRADQLDRLAGNFADLVGGDLVPPTAQVEIELSDTDEASQALSELTRALVQNSPLLCIHAAVVAHPRGVVTIPGHSGLGKTTLAGALTLAGFSYLSDEALALDRHSLAVAAFPRPLSLAPDVWPLLGLAATPAPGEIERQFAPRLFGSVAESRDWPMAAPRVTDVLLARRTGGAAAIVAGEQSVAVTALLSMSFNHYRDPSSSLQTVLDVVRSARIWRATYSDALELARLVREHFSQLA